MKRIGLFYLVASLMMLGALGLNAMRLKHWGADETVLAFAFWTIGFGQGAHAGSVRLDKAKARARKALGASKAVRS